jgi:hypothetical protein
VYWLIALYTFCLSKLEKEKMDPEQYANLVEWHRGTQKAVRQLQYAIVFYGTVQIAGLYLVWKGLGSTLF